MDRPPKEHNKTDCFTIPMPPPAGPVPLSKQMRDRMRLLDVMIRGGAFNAPDNATPATRDRAEEGIEDLYGVIYWFEHAADIVERLEQSVTGAKPPTLPVAYRNGRHL